MYQIMGGSFYRKIFIGMQDSDLKVVIHKSGSISEYLPHV